MATDDGTLVAEVRALTDYDETIMSDLELLALVDVAKEEIKADVDDTTITFYSGDQKADRALFWLTCLFAKIKLGEIEAPNVSISSLRIRQASVAERYGVWVKNFEKNLAGIVTSDGEAAVGRPMGHTKVARTESERSYGYEDSTDTTTDIDNLFG
jgi:hypothetical protein